MRADATSDPAPEAPELPAGARRYPSWPWWMAPLAFLVGLVATTLIVVPIAAIAGVGDDTGSAAFVVIGTLVQGVVFGATALFFASRVARPRAWHFGFTRVPFWQAAGWAALGLLSYYVFTAIYGALVSPDVEQDTVQDLGGDQGTLGLIVAGAMVIAVAPVIEEFFFRGFFYRALRSRAGILFAALADGLLFGIIHYPGQGLEGFLILPPLAFLGAMFCLVYERTGTLLAPIALHAINNAVAYAVLADDGWRVSVVLGPLAIVACVLASRRFPRGSRVLPASRGAPRVAAAAPPG